MEKKLVPYNLYLHTDQVDRLRKLSKERKASALIRDAVYMILDKQDQYQAGYNRALQDASVMINKLKEIAPLFINNKSLADSLVEHLEDLKK